MVNPVRLNDYDPEKAYLAWYRRQRMPRNYQGQPEIKRGWLACWSYLADILDALEKAKQPGGPEAPKQRGRPRKKRNEDDREA